MTKHHTFSIMRWLAIILASLCLSLSAETTPANPALTPPATPTLEAQMGMPFRNNAVLQQKLPLPIWGASLPNAKVTVTFDGQSKTTTADPNGNWKVVLDPLTAIKLKTVNDAPDGKTMTVTCEKEGQKAVTEIKNLVIGEVWLCAGQSNMAGAMRRTVPDANYPALRQMVSPKPEWTVCTPENAAVFKRVCFFFARRVQQDALVPIGIINASVGGSNIESWLNQPPFEDGSNYKAMITPFIGYGIHGMIWYQGESNASDGRGYEPKLTSLITGWRKIWNQPDSVDAGGPQAEFSAYFVQLPGIGVSPTDNPAMGDGRAEIRQAYFETLSVKNTGMAIALDVGDLKEHPPNKLDTGIRLARLALHRDYGFADLVPSGPLYKSHKVEGSAIRVSFDYAQKGLMVAAKSGYEPPTPTPDKKLGWLSIQSKDGTWHWAEGTIDGADLIVSSKDVQEPVAVRYAYTNHPTPPLLYNTDGLPAGPFSTGGYGPETQVPASKSKTGK